MRSGDDHPRSSRLLRGRLGAAGPAAAMMVVGVVIVISRRPDAVTNAQFWAEDGKYWFAAAYNHGAQALPPGVTAWTALTTSNVAERYFLMAEIAWLVCLVWTISRIPRRRLTTAAALALAVGSPAT